MSFFCSANWIWNSFALLEDGEAAQLLMLGTPHYIQHEYRRYLSMSMWKEELKAELKAELRAEFGGVKLAPLVNRKGPPIEVRGPVTVQKYVDVQLQEAGNKRFTQVAVILQLALILVFAVAADYDTELETDGVGGMVCSTKCMI